MGYSTATLPQAGLRTFDQIRRNGRKLQRQRLQRDAWVVLLQPQLPRQKITTTNISPAGLGFTTDRPLQAGSQFILRLRVDEENGGLYLCSVKYCRAGERGQFSAGAEFKGLVPNPAAPVPAAWLNGMQVEGPVVC